MPQENSKPEKGKLLIAKPLLGDPNFDRTVILLTDHGESGSVGFVLNRQVDAALNDLLPGFTQLEGNVFLGGPVQQNNLFFIHRKGDLIPGSHEITDGIYWGGDLEALQEMAGLNLLKDSDINFYLGYSGWGEDQLEMELYEDSWIIENHQIIDLFEDSPEEMWSKIVKNKGGDYSLWANSPADPNLN